MVTEHTDRVIVERNVRVPMRDGVELATDVHRPDDDERHPVLLERTPVRPRLRPDRAGSTRSR